MRKITFIIFISCFFGVSAEAQQNSLMFFSHYLPESNLLNPAVQSPCPWYIGIPVLSSTHLNYANSGFTYNDLFNSTSGDSVEMDINGVVDQLGRRTYIGTEAHTQLLALGHKRNEYYFNFTLSEKTNFPTTLPIDAVTLAWHGNTQFEGEEAQLKGTANYFIYYREYALGVSKETRNGNFWGLKGKLLFGKLNISTKELDLGLRTDENTFDLAVKGQATVKTSLPIIVNKDADGYVSSINIDESVSLSSILLNRKNWGLAFDAGFIREYNEKVTLSGSILDLGFIAWRSNQQNFETRADFNYTGVLNDSTYILDVLTDSLKITNKQDTYYALLPSRVNLGASYALRPRVIANVLGSAVIYKTKFLPSLSFSLDFEALNNVHLIAGYTLQYRSYNNIGFGISAGKGPTQFYAVTDNLLGLIYPLSTQNLNIRFGLNINLGCGGDNDSDNREYQSSLKAECYWAEKGVSRAKRKNKWNIKHR